VSIEKFHSVVLVLQKTHQAIERAIPDFHARSVLAEPPALTGVLLRDLHLRLLLLIQDRDPIVSFTIQVKNTRIDGYFGGRPIFLWAGDGLGFHETVLARELFTHRQETHIYSNPSVWFATIEEICRIAVGNTQKPNAILVSCEKGATHTTQRRYDTGPIRLVSKVSN
jgi:hypothetical protein